MDLREKARQPRQLRTYWLRGYSFFDKYHRPIHTLQGNHLGGEDLSYTSYDFAGKALKSKLVHQKPGATAAAGSPISTPSYADPLNETRFKNVEFPTPHDQIPIIA